MTNCGHFTQTKWSLVFTAGNSNSEDASAALGELFQRYQGPLYSYLRGTGSSHADAEDLLGSYFQMIIQKHWLAAADPNRGRFRNFLLSCLKHFKANEWRRRHAQRRGSGQQVLSMDDPDEGPDWREVAGNETTPDAIFDRRWALEILRRAQARLRQAYIEANEGGRFALLESRLMDDDEDSEYAELGARLGLTANGVKTAVRRMRRRLGEMMREEVADTVASRVDVESEMQHLMAALRGP